MDEKLFDEIAAELDRLGPTDFPFSDIDSLLMGEHDGHTFAVVLPDGKLHMVTRDEIELDWDLGVFLIDLRTA